MERVETLLQKLQQQMKDGETASRMLLTVQMLQHELQRLKTVEPQTPASASVVVEMPVSLPAEPVSETVAEELTPPETEEKIIEVLQVDEAEIEAELEEIKRNAAVLQQISMHSKPQLLFDPADDDIPTLVHHQPVVQKPAGAQVENDASLNDKLKETRTEIADALNEAPVKDLKKAIGVNDRFLYINELFRGDESMYERSIKTINSFSIWPEAEYWIRRELKTKLGWIDSNETVKQFDQLIRRRFS